MEPLKAKATKAATENYNYSALGKQKMRTKTKYNNLWLIKEKEQNCVF